ncbi:hypothetical protein [Microbacterium soli]|uniref:PPE family domain-containing protein n=1 Tax=Microbacterium soli TaxID=446075 RepID=A0ABP7MYB5_9MICO
MGHNVERLGRLESSMTSYLAEAARQGQSRQRTTVTRAVAEAANGVESAANSDGFEGNLGETVRTGLTKIRSDLERFTEYQVEVNKAIIAADSALQSTAGDIAGLPQTGLTSAQQSTIDLAIRTESPVQVRPGTTMTPAQARQYYLDQAEGEREEAARRLTAALDARLQEIIDGMPTSDYDPPRNVPGPAAGSGPLGPGAMGAPDLGITGYGIAPVGGFDGGGGDYDAPRVVRVDGPDIPDGSPYPPSEQWERPPGGYDGPPRVDGVADGWVPGTGPGGSGLPAPGSGIPGGAGGASHGGVGGVVGGTAGGVGGAALAGRLGRVGGLGGLGGLGALGAPGAAGAGAPGAGAVGAQAGAGAGAGAGRTGMIAGGAAGGAGGAGEGRRRRRRGQDLLAFEVDPDDEDALPDLGAAGEAGSSASDGYEELGW